MWLLAVLSSADCSLAVCTWRHTHKDISSHSSHTKTGLPVKSVERYQPESTYCWLLMQQSQPPTVRKCINWTPEPIFSFFEFILWLVIQLNSMFFSFTENCTKQRNCHPTHLRLTMKTWTRMRSVMTIFSEVLFYEGIITGCLHARSHIWCFDLFYFM